MNIESKQICHSDNHAFKRCVMFEAGDTKIWAIHFVNGKLSSHNFEKEIYQEKAKRKLQHLTSKHFITPQTLILLYGSEVKLLEHIGDLFRAMLQLHCKRQHIK